MFGLDLEVRALDNITFGSVTTVAGLLAGRDFLAQIEPGEADLLLVSPNVLRYGTETLLDDVTLDDLRRALRMRVEVGAVAGERWSDEGGDAGRSVAAEGYRDARAEVVLGAGESAEFVIRAAFEPERVVIDPDLMVLQLRRRDAVFAF